MGAMVKKTVKVSVAKAFSIDSESMTLVEVVSRDYVGATSETRAKRDFKADSVKFDVVKLIESGTATYAMPLDNFIMYADVVSEDVE